MQLKKPIVGIVCDVIKYGVNNFHGAGEKYINAIAHGANAIPVILPSPCKGEDLQPLHDFFDDDFFQQLNGIFLPGSPSNVEPHHYGDETSATPDDHDKQRDATSLPLIKLAIEKKIPLLAVCRGMQEFNVAMGGQLYQQLHQQGQFIEHREDKSAPRAEQYSLSHDISLVNDGLLATLLGKHNHQVNSIHGQGIKTLGQGLSAEAHAPDGLIEAIRINNNQQFALGVQWHPEWQFQNDALSSAIFSAFGNAVHHNFQTR